MNNIQLFPPIEHMAQGLAYWMGYRQEMFASHRMKEDVAVEEAVKLLKSRIDNATYTVDCEVPYSKIDPLNKTGELADLVITNKKGVFFCIIEFKKSDASMKAIEGDISKLSTISVQGIDKFEIILFQRRSKKLMNKICCSSYNNIYRSIDFSGIKGKGRRLCKAWESQSTTYPSVAVIEIV